MKQSPPLQHKAQSMEKLKKCRNLVELAKVMRNIDRGVSSFAPQALTESLYKKQDTNILEMSYFSSFSDFKNVFMRNEDYMKSSRVGSRQVAE